MKSEIIAAIIGSSVAGLGMIINSLINYKQNRKLLQASQRMTQQRKDEIKIENFHEQKQTILKKLNNFYYPLSICLNRSKNLFETFKSDKPEGFKTLIYLLEKNHRYDNVGETKLNETDRFLLDEIFSIGSEIENLINRNYGIIDDPEFVTTYKPSDEFSDVTIDKDLSLLSLLKTHIRTIRKAYKEKLKGDPKRFAIYVYPKELNSKVIEKIDDLNKQINECDEEILKLIGN